MSWELVLQSFTMGLSGIACFFLYDLVREFKAFKVRAQDDIFELKTERIEMKHLIKEAEISFLKRCDDLENAHKNYVLNAEKSLVKANDLVTKLNDKLSKTLEDTTQLKDTVTHFTFRVQAHDEDIDYIKERLHDILFNKQLK